MADHLYATIPELAATEDDELMTDLLASAEANLRQVLWVLKRGAGVDEVRLPPEAAAFMRANVRRGIPLPAELRAYRLGHAWLWDRWARALQERIADPDELIAAQETSSACIFAYIDRVSDELVEEYGTERERMMRGAAQLRAETVRAILAREPLDEETLPGRLGYDVRRTHVAMRVSSGTSEIRGLERAAREAAAALAPGEPLVVPSGAASLDVWAGSYEPLDTRALERYEPPDGVRVAFGRPGRGLDGFRRSHREAVQAARVASLAGSGAARWSTTRRSSSCRCSRATSLARASSSRAGSGRWRRRASRHSGCARRCACSWPWAGGALAPRRSSTSIRTRSPTGSSARRSCSAAASPRTPSSSSARWRSPTRSGRRCSRSADGPGARLCAGSPTPRPRFGGMTQARGAGPTVRSSP